MHAVDFLDAHRFALSGLVLWILINAQAVKFIARAREAFDGIADADAAPSMLRAGARIVPRQRTSSWYASR